jgi:hypothetical protein
MSKRPLITDLGRIRELTPAERIPLQHAPVYVESTLSWAQTTPNRFQLMMTAGVVDYVLPALPNGAIEVQINGVGVNYTLSGVNLHITEYNAGTIESTDELTVYYTGSVAAGSDMFHELVVCNGETVMVEAA